MLPTGIHLIDITHDNILTMEVMNSILFPVSYEPSFSQQLLSKPNYFGVYFSTSYAPLGLCTYQTNFDGVYVMTFGIMPEHRNQGIGTLCMKRVEERILNTVGRSKVRLHVHENNVPALNFYFKLGYSKVGIDYLYYSDMVPKTAFILEKELDQDYETQINK